LILQVTPFSSGQGFRHIPKGERLVGDKGGRERRFLSLLRLPHGVSENRQECIVLDCSQAEGLSPATFDEHEDITVRDHDMGASHDQESTRS
jgi:hypothetical protein